MIHQIIEVILDSFWYYLVLNFLIEFKFIKSFID